MAVWCMQSAAAPMHVCPQVHHLTHASIWLAPDGCIYSTGVLDATCVWNVLHEVAIVLVGCWCTHGLHTSCDGAA